MPLFIDFPEIIGVGEGIVGTYLAEGAKVVFCGRLAEKGSGMENAWKAKSYDVFFIQVEISEVVRLLFLCKLR